MQYRPFGKTGWKVSEVGLGTWQIGGHWGPTNDTESLQTLLCAFEKGINYVDTAFGYGNGHSEEIIGQALKCWKGSKIYVATKAPPVRWPSPEDDHPLMRGRYPEWYLREQVEASLGRLGVECLDLFQLHCWIEEGVECLDWLETLNKLKLEGKIDRIGVSLRDYRPEEGITLANLGLVDSQQVIFNIFEQRPIDHLFRVGELTGTTFIARVPYDSGSLVGEWTHATYQEWGKEDIRQRFFRGERFHETLDRIRLLKETCSPFFSSLAEAALRYSLSDSAVSVVIPGMKNRAEVEMNTRYSDGKKFPAELAAALEPHRWARNYYA